MKANIGVSIHNKFEIEVRDAKTGKLKQTVCAYNIVLDTMWSTLLNNQDYITRIYIGTGTGTLDSTRTALFSALGYKTPVFVERVYGESEASAYQKNKIILNPEDYVGSVITEVGLYGAYGMVTHALLEDSEGTPISITKTAFDVVTIYATVYATVSTDANIDLIGMPSSNELLQYLVQQDTSLASINFYADAIGGTTDDVLNAGVVVLGQVGGSFDTKDTANKKMTTNLARLATTAANGHIKSILLGNIGRIVLPHATICPPMTYTDVPIGSGNGAETEFVLPSHNIDEGELVVKNNGSVVSNFTVETRRRMNYRHSSSYYHGGSGFSQYPAYMQRDPSSKHWIGVGQNDLQYGVVANGRFQQKGELTALTYTNEKFGIALTGSTAAVCISIAPTIRSLDISGDVPVDLEYTFDTAPTNSLACALNADGTHLAVMTTVGVLRYKLIGAEWQKLAGVSGEKTVISSTASYAKFIKYFGDYLVVSCGTTSPYTQIMKCSGDVYTLCTIDSATPWVHSVGWDAVRSKMIIPSSVASTIDVFSFSGTAFTKDGSITMPETLGAVDAALLTDDDYIFLYHGSQSFGYCSLYKWNGALAVEKMPIDSEMTAYLQTDINMDVDNNYVVMGGDRAPSVMNIEAKTKYLVFDSAVADGNPITATYDVDGIHKTDQYVVDLQVTMTFGEPT